MFFCLCSCLELVVFEGILAQVGDYDDICKKTRSIGEIPYLFLQFDGVAATGCTDQ